MTKSALVPRLMILTLFLLFICGLSDPALAANPKVVAGGNHTLALRADGTIWAWGDNAFGQLGDGTVVSRNVPVRVGTDTDWSDISTGMFHTLALKTDGTLWAWGDNTKGQLGDGLASFSRSTPAKIVTDTNWFAISAGDFHSLARKSDSSLWAWGDNGSGQLGNGSVVPGIQPVPLRIGTDTVTRIAAGSSHSLAIKALGTRWGWGANGAGQLGNGTELDAVAPVKIELPPPALNFSWNAVSAGKSHSLAIWTNNSLWAWGSNNSGQLGNGTNADSNVPVQVTGGPSSWLAVAAGDTHTVGRDFNNSLWTWGGNQSGQLGNGTTAAANLPVKLGADTDWYDAAAGSAHTVARKGTGVWCWGDNVSGQLGDGTNIPKNSPVQIPFNISALPVTMTAAAAAGGAISPSGASIVIQGTSQTYTITPNPGFIVTNLVVDDVVLPGATTHTFTNISANHYINAYFAPSELTVIAAAGPNGSISPAGTTAVTPGSSQTYTITPNAGFKAAALVVDGVLLPGATSYTFSGIAASHYLNAYFEPSGLAITAAAGPNGSISPAGETAVTPGSSQSYTITPNAGFMVATLVVDGTQLPGKTSHTFSDINASHYLNAYFAPLPATVTITAAAGPNGSISPAGATTASGGTDQTFTITPNPGFSVAALVVDGTVLPAATSYTFTNVTADHYINAYFQ